MKHDETKMIPVNTTERETKKSTNEGEGGGRERERNIMKFDTEWRERERAR